MAMAQFASAVANFSSQYGTNQSYCAANLAGPPLVGEKYGDFVEAFVLRSYGTWWKRCPSAVSQLAKKASTFHSEDFVELEYDEAIVPTSIKIYETYHPGSVVRILACNAGDQTVNSPGKVEWITLWSGSPQCSHVPQRVRKFSPKLKKINFPTKLIRLEFNSSECDYYTELDAVELIGHKPKQVFQYGDRAKGFALSLTTKLLRQLSLTERQTSINDEEDEEFEKWGHFSFLPDELIQQIMSYLDLISLCSMAQACSLFLKNAYDPFMYRDLDLQSKWNTVDDVALESLTSRCSSLQRLNLSWTGGGGQITEPTVCRFLEACGSELKTLRLGSCQYVSAATIDTIVRVCTQLEELDLQSCTQLTGKDLQHVHMLKSLKRLNLYSFIGSEDLLAVVGKCTKLEHLNLGAVRWFSGLNLSYCLSQLKNLISLDLWRCKMVDFSVINTLAENCPNLQELDIGWCTGILRPFTEEGFEAFASKCTRLKKLFLTSGRNTADPHLKALAEFCPDLEQVDILGTNRVTVEGVTQLCKSCKKLFFFDLSFCQQLTEDVVTTLRRNYPHITFKKSFQ